MKHEIKKGLVAPIVLLLIGLSVIPSTGNLVEDAHDVGVKEITSLFRDGSKHYAYIDTHELLCWDWGGNWTFLGDAPGTYFLLGGTWTLDKDYPWWVSQYGGYTNGSAIWRINTEGDYEQVTSNCNGVLIGMAYDLKTKQLYGCDIDKLYIIDMETGNATLVGNMSGRYFLGMGINQEGQGYGIDILTDCLYRINLEDASTELVGSLGINLNYFNDCAFDINAGPDVFYLVAYTFSPYGSGWYICDTETGHCTCIGGFFFEMAAYAISYDDLPPELLNIIGPHYGKPGVNYTFCIEVVDPDGDEIYCIWDWGDGTNTGWLGPYNSGETICASHAWSEEGIYEIKVKLKDQYGNEGEWSNPYTIIIDGGVPYIEITKPQRAIYIRDTKIIPFILPVIFGDIQIWFSAEDNLSGLNRTELFIDDELKEIFTIIPKSWTWNKTTPWKYKHVIELIAYDNAGNNATKNMMVWRFF